MSHKRSSKVVDAGRSRALVPWWRSKAMLGAMAVMLVTTGALGYAFRDRLFADGGDRHSQAQNKPMESPKVNVKEAPGPAPEGMVWIPGGEFYMGTEDKNLAHDAPVHKVYVDGFWLGKHEVTNEEFARFVKATGYVTVAERALDPKDFPGVPRDKLKPFSPVFKQPGPKDPVDLRRHEGWWDVGYGASWKHPEGPGSGIQGKEKHPVVHVCHDDALAYCKWAKLRLPTEAEWEFAARGGLDRKLYSWGDALLPEGKWMANIWQGNFPYDNKKTDGYFATAPVGSFPPNGYGVHDMAGNVWEWCADWYQADYYEVSADKNPKGPLSGFDPREPGVPKRVQRGGSFLCADNYCVRYVMGTRGKGESSSGGPHIGFRCARDAK